MEPNFLPLLLHGAWRPVPEPLSGVELPIAEWTNSLTSIGVGGLIGRRLQQEQQDKEFLLLQAYRMQILQGSMQERFISELFDNFQGAGVQALLIKGWASAQYYGAKGLRPFGDLDIHVLPSQLGVAKDVLRHTLASAKFVMEVDLKSHFETRSLTGVYGNTSEEFIENAVTVFLGATPVLVPRPEDHLHLVALHCLKHGASRPLWLCDVAAALEARTPNFDWDLCLGTNRLRREWVAHVLILAHELFGANIDSTPLADREFVLPNWLIPTVLRQWENTLWQARHELEPELALSRLRSLVAQHLRTKWKDPITASVLFQVSFSAPVQRPLQVLLYLYSYAPGLKAMYSRLRPRA